MSSRSRCRAHREPSSAAAVGSLSWRSTVLSTAQQQRQPTPRSGVSILATRSGEWNSMTATGAADRAESRPRRRARTSWSFPTRGRASSTAYFDRWEDGIFHYTGEGQVGDQQVAGGNRAILERAVREVGDEAADAVDPSARSPSGRVPSLGPRGRRGRGLATSCGATVSDTEGDTTRM
jgi:hypothetical protein